MQEGRGEAIHQNSVVKLGLDSHRKVLMQLHERAHERLYWRGPRAGH